MKKLKRIQVVWGNWHVCLRVDSKESVVGNKREVESLQIWWVCNTSWQKRKSLWGREKEFQFLSHETRKHCLIHLVHYTHASERACFPLRHEETCHRKRDAKVWLGEEVGILSLIHLVCLHTFDFSLVRSGSQNPRIQFLELDFYFVILTCTDKLTMPYLLCGFMKPSWNADVFCLS